ncbi:HWE histidine kinase domain-containing protein [Microbaculum sp. FT89]|uniref:sensor histidine kinase n=1 Tax=Microbaculum sp. FT89 TaxID=3447298 RepID=UPI003F53D246
MDQIVEYLFGAANFVPHGYCMTWRPDLVALHAISDAGIAAAYFAIPLAIVVFARRRGDITGEARQIAILFSAFIVLCGITHLGGLLTLWYPYYGLDGMAKAATAFVSIMTAIVVWRMLPRLVAIASPRQIEAINQRLVEEAAARDRAYGDLEAARRDLERQVAERTRELAEVRQLFEAATRGAQITVSSQDRDLRYTWIHNPWLGMNETDVVGKADEALFPEPACSTIVGHKRRAIETSRPDTFEVEIPNGDASSWYRIDVTPLTDGQGGVTGIACTAIDITGPKRLEEMRADLSRRLSESVQRFNVALRSGDIVVFSQDTDLRYIWTNRNDTALRPVVGKTDADLHKEPDLTPIVALKTEAMAAKEPRSGEIRVDSGDAVRWFDLFVEPTVAVDGVVTGVTCAAIDITDAKRSEEQMRLVMRELTHRSKNLLAVVQAIARQTAQQAGTVAEFVDGFGERLRALAGAQDLLVAENWSGARLEQVIRGQIGHYMPQDRSRVVVEGPDVNLTPEATQVLALALHELATNAAKYGALSNDVGIVTVTWSLDGTGDDVALHFEWQETGGPPVEPPTRRGFGRIVVEQNVARSLDAQVDLQFPQQGVRANFVIPLEQLNPPVQR